MPSCFPMIFQMEGCARCGRTPRREIRGPFSETSPLIAFGVWLCIARVSTPDTTLWLAYSVLGSKPRFKSVLFFQIVGAVAWHDSNFSPVLAKEIASFDGWCFNTAATRDDSALCKARVPRSTLVRFFHPDFLIMNSLQSFHFSHYLINDSSKLFWLICFPFNVNQKKKKNLDPP